MSQSTERGMGGNPLTANPLGRIAELLGDKGLTCHVVFVSRKKVNSEDGDSRRHDFELVGMNLRKRAYTEIVRRYKEFAKAREDWDLISVKDNDDGGEPPEQSCYVENLSSVPFYEEYLKKPADDGKKHFDSKFISTIAAIQFRFTSNAGTVVFIKKLTPGKILKQKKRTIFKIVSGDLDVEKDNVVDLPEGCDCCVFDEQMLIFARGRYENLFDYHARYEAAHNKVFENLKKRIDYKIDEIETLEGQTLRDPAKLRRFIAIKNKGIWKKTFAEIRTFLENRPIKGVSATINPNRLSFKDSRALIRFFNDSHLDSIVTGTRYLASAKTEE